MEYGSGLANQTYHAMSARSLRDPGNDADHGSSRITGGEHNLAITTRRSCDNAQHPSVHRKSQFRAHQEISCSLAET